MAKGKFAIGGSPWQRKPLRWHFERMHLTRNNPERELEPEHDDFHDLVEESDREERAFEISQEIAEIRRIQQPYDRIFWWLERRIADLDIEQERLRR
jgi:hypothetical protein